MTLTFSKQQPVQDPGVEGVLAPADRQIVNRLTDAIEEILGDGPEAITREDLRRHGFSEADIDLFWDTAFMAAIARRSVREVLA